MKPEEIVALDLKHVWHPCSQMKDYEDFPPIPIESAKGAILYTSDGREIIDAISSWWCKSLGHCNARIHRSVIRQMEKFEHVIMANTCNDVVAQLSAELSKLIPGKDKVFYADNGSTGVEIAMKLSLQYHMQTGSPEKKLFAGLKNGYHGETVLTLAAGDCELYSKPFAHISPKIPKIGPIPFVSGDNDPQWESMDETTWAEIESQLNKYADQLTAIIFEPIVQGAGNMKIYSPDLLRRFRKWADNNEVHLIADEIMTGFGRTGKMLACEHAGIIPDFAILSKGLTGGFGPLSAVLCSTEVYDAFYDDYFSGKAFMHSNTYTGYALSVAAALEALKIYKDDKVIDQVRKRSGELRERMMKVADETGALINVRSVGFIAAADIIDPTTGRPFDSKLRTGYRCYRKAVELGALLRPLGDTLYFFPPLNCEDEVLDRMAEIAVKALSESIRSKRVTI